jgi:hypothetical protein
MLPFASMLVAGVADTAWGWSGSRTMAADTGRRFLRSRALGPILVATGPIGGVVSENVTNSRANSAMGR